jgi:hypothetical protein
MSIAELKKEALALPENQRAQLIASLLETLPPANAEISDQEVAERDADLQSGRTAEMSEDEFIRAVERDRRK